MMISVVERPSQIAVTASFNRSKQRPNWSTAPMIEGTCVRLLHDAVNTTKGDAGGLNPENKQRAPPPTPHTGDKQGHLR